MDQKRMIEFIDPDICNTCGKKTLEIYNRYDKPLGLSLALQSGEVKMFQKLNARYFKCRNCGMDYPIQWNGDIPIPLTDSNFNLFFDRYKNCGKGDK